MNLAVPVTYKGHYRYFLIRNTVFSIILRGKDSFNNLIFLICITHLTIYINNFNKNEYVIVMDYQIYD